jgi:hypothetical protein
MYNLSAPKVFSTSNTFLHLEMQFKQQNIMISYRFMLLDSGEKGQNVVQLDNAYFQF